MKTQSLVMIVTLATLLVGVALYHLTNALRQAAVTIDRPR